MAHRIMSCTAALLALVIWCSDAYGQQAAPEATLTLDQLVGAAKRYFRDTAEFPLQQKMTFVVSDTKGRVRQTKSQLTEYVFQGYKSREKTASFNLHGKVSFWQAMRGSNILKIAASSALWTMIPGGVLNAEQGEYTFAAKSIDPAADRMSAQFIPNKPCPALTMTDKASFYLPDEVCGTSGFEVYRDLKFQKFVFEVGGLPAPVKINPFGQCTLQRYYAEVEFQSVMLPGDKEPFLIPRQSVTRLETDKGTIVMTSVFEPKK